MRDGPACAEWDCGAILPENPHLLRPDGLTLVMMQVFGKRLNLHPVVVLFALVFWYMMWGLPGAFLSVPIMSVLKILCLNMDNMTAQWFARLLGAPTSWR